MVLWEGWDRRVGILSGVLGSGSPPFLWEKGMPCYMDTGVPVLNCMGTTLIPQLYSWWWWYLLLQVVVVPITNKCISWYCKVLLRILPLTCSQLCKGPLLTAWEASSPNEQIVSNRGIHVCHTYFPYVPWIIPACCDTSSSISQFFPSLSSGIHHTLEKVLICFSTRPGVNDSIVATSVLLKPIKAANLIHCASRPFRKCQTSFGKDLSR